MSLTDRLGEMAKATRWQLMKDTDDDGDEVFSVVVTLGPPTDHTITTGQHKNVYKAVDEAIAEMNKHLAMCPCS